MKPLALVIQHDGSTRRLLDVILTRFGFDVDHIATGSDGLSLIEAFAYDVVVLDTVLPGTGGVALLRWIGANRPATMARTIVLTGDPETEVMRLVGQFPAARVIRKPFELGEMLDTARAAADRAEPHQRTFTAEFCRRSILAGARAGMLVATDGSRVSLVCTFGFDPEVIGRYFPMPISSAYPICAAMRHARPVWFASIAAASSEFPLLLPIWRTSESRALAAAPVSRGGRVIGAAGWSFREVRMFGEAETRTLTAIAEATIEGLPTADGDDADQSANSRGA